MPGCILISILIDGGSNMVILGIILVLLIIYVICNDDGTFG